MRGNKSIVLYQKPEPDDDVITCESPLAALSCLGAVT